MRRPAMTILLLGALICAPAAAAARTRLGVASARYDGSRPGALNRLGAAWAYDWSATPPPTVAGPPWVPMVWGPGSVTPETIASLRRLHRSGRADDLLGFNEPDSSSQSDMTPRQAAALWPRLESTGLTLGSPAPAVATDGWLAHFMALARARHLRVDFIAVHDYQDVTDPLAVAELRSQLVALHRAYHRPIWITELGAIDLTAWGEPMEHPITRAAADRYLRRVVAMVDRLGFVARLAWFTDGCSDDIACRDDSLLTGSGRLTATGATFRALSR